MKLVMSERIESVIPATYILCNMHAIMGWFGNNANLLGNIKVTIWHYAAIEDLVEIYDLKSKEWSKGSQSYPEDTWEHACVALHIPSCRTEDSSDLNLK